MRHPAEFGLPSIVNSRPASCSSTSVVTSYRSPGGGDASMTVAGWINAVRFRMGGHLSTLKVIYAVKPDRLEWEDAVDLLQFLGIQNDNKNGDHTYIHL